MEYKEINSFKELFEYADFTTIFVDTEPKIINPEDIDIVRQKKYSDIRVVKNNETENKIIVKPTTYHYPIKFNEDVSFTNPKTNEVHLLNPYDTVLLNNVNGKWDFEVVSDMRDFEKRFEEVAYNQYKVEEKSLDSLKDHKCEKLKQATIDKLEDFKDDLKEKSSMKIGLFKIKF